MTAARPGAPRSGVLPVEKGPGVTSFQVVAHVRRLLRALKVGHGGTLDPDATGLLPILVGEGTKLTPYLGALDKEYVARIRLGLTTDTQDASGKVLTNAHNLRGDEQRHLPRPQIDFVRELGDDRPRAPFLGTAIGRRDSRRSRRMSTNGITRARISRIVGIPTVPRMTEFGHLKIRSR